MPLSLKLETRVRPKGTESSVAQPFLRSLLGTGDHSGELRAGLPLRCFRVPVCRGGEASSRAVEDLDDHSPASVRQDFHRELSVIQPIGFSSLHSYSLVIVIGSKLSGRKSHPSQNGGPTYVNGLSLV